MALLKIISIIILVVFFHSGTAFAQFASQAQDSRTEEDKKMREEEAVAELRKTEKPTEKKVDYSLNYGGWITSYYWHFKNLDNDDTKEDWVKDMWLQDIRGWVKIELYQTLTTYARLRYYHVENRSSEDYTGEKDGIYGPYLDMCYARCDLEPRHNIPFKTTLGRQYLKLGRGIVYSSVHDGLLIETDITPQLYFKTFGSKTKPHDRGLDYSAPGYKKKHKRYFWGAEFAYRGIQKDVFYTYTLLQRDRSWEEPEDGAQDYHYNSQYYGLGATGEPIKDFKYWAEVIKEYGNTYVDSSKSNRNKCRIDAWGYNVGGKYQFDFITHPVLELETAFGSGDKDRERVTNARGGNVLGDDNNFLYYGTFSAGYASMPRLSNMFIHKAGCLIKPFQMCNFLNLNEMAIGAKYYFYHKDKKKGGIYDVEASLNKKIIGQEVDLYLYWKVYHNLYYSMRYGVFYPGSAYPSNTNNISKYFLARLTLLF